MRYHKAPFMDQFCLYVNNLTKFLPNCFIIQYGDDTKIWIIRYITKLKDLIKKVDEILNRSIYTFTKMDHYQMKVFLLALANTYLK